MIILDTSIAVRYLAGETIPALEGLFQNLEKEGGKSPVICVSAISAGEIVKLVKHGDIVLAVDTDVWVDAALSTSRVRWLPVTPHVAVAAEALPAPPDGIDVYDRIITATSRCYNAPLVTANKAILSYPAVNGIDWQDKKSLIKYVKLLEEPLRT